MAHNIETSYENSDTKDENELITALNQEEKRLKDLRLRLLAKLKQQQTFQ